MMGNKSLGLLDSESRLTPGLGSQPHIKMGSPFSDKREFHVIKLDLLFS